MFGAASGIGGADCEIGIGRADDADRWDMNIQVIAAPIAAETITVRTKFQGASRRRDALLLPLMGKPSPDFSGEGTILADFAAISCSNPCCSILCLCSRPLSSTPLRQSRC